MNYIEKLAMEIRSSVSAETSIPDESDQLFYMYALLLLSKGTRVTSYDVHNAWSAWMSSTNPEHKSIQPFDKLPQEIQEMDLPFVDAIKKVATSDNRPNAEE